MAVVAALAGSYPFTPYCGAPPDPASLAWRWNLDPVLIAALALIALAYAMRFKAAGGPAAHVPWRPACFYGGLATATLALVSPLCALSVSLFSARVGQHMILAMVAAPLMALGRPIGTAFGRHGWERPPGGGAAAMAAGAFAVALWWWHAPAPYRATFESVGVYWLMHATAFGAALWLWSSLFAASGRRIGDFLAAAAITTAQMGFLGAIITFAGQPLYDPHRFTTAAFGLTPLEDQELGGVIMWIPAGAILVAAILAAVAMVIARAQAPRPAPAAP